MASENESARKVLGDTVQALVDRYGGVRKLARALGDENTYAGQVSKWRRGQDIGLSTMSLLAARLEQPIEFTFTPSGELRVNAKEPPPEWARALAQETAEDVVRRLVPPDLLGAAHRLLAQLAELPPPSDEAQLEEREAQDQVG